MVKISGLWCGVVNHWTRKSYPPFPTIYCPCAIAYALGAHASVCCEIIGRNMCENLQSPRFCNRINSSLLQALLAQAGLKTCGHGKLVAFGWRGAHVYVASLLGACGWDSMPFSCPNSRARASKLGGLCPFFVATRCFPKLLVHIFGREGIIT